MIKISRTDVPPPDILASARARNARNAARAFFLTQIEERSQRTFNFDVGVYDHREVRSALTRLFEDKCAICESRLGEKGWEVSQFRPRENSLNLNGVVDRDHYWWLAYDWGNLYPICSECSRFRGARFPVKGPRAATESSVIHAHGTERYLLLDPSFDDTGRHFVFAASGEVIGKTERGRITIDAFGLNRSLLVESRAREIQALRAEWDELCSRYKRIPKGRLTKLYDRRHQYSFMRRQISLGWDLERRRNSDQKTVVRHRLQVTSTDPVWPGWNRSAAYFMRYRSVDSVKIRNFRLIRELQIQCRPSEPSAVDGPGVAPWRMLLGENGTAKTSVLQALAMALMGQRALDRLRIDPLSLVRHGAAEGFVEVRFETGETSTLRVTTDGCFASSPDPTVLLLGYGGVRLGPQKLRKTGAHSRPSPVKVTNLFDPCAPVHPIPWLLGLSSRSFDVVARALRLVLPLSEDQLIERSGSELFISGGGKRFAFRGLSEGYQATIALVSDIMSVVMRRWSSDAREAEGLVLIDELGAHLHPRWQMRIVSSLRQVFPRIQFIATTHSPLCLRGLRDGEVSVLRRTESNAIVSLEDLPKISGMRVEQILTSEFFGLGSTIDPELERHFERYYKLLANPSRSSLDDEELGRLKDLLSSVHLLGATKRESLMLQAIDEYLAQKPDLVEQGKDSLISEETRRKVAKIWDRVGLGDVR